MHLLNRQCQYKAYKDVMSNFVFKSRPILPSVWGFAISSDGYFSDILNRFDFQCLYVKIAIILLKIAIILLKFLAS